MPDDKFTTPCPLPTPYERELLTILIEECAEVAQRATKMLRFGRDEIQPGQHLDNAQRLAFEVGDLLALVELCIAENLIAASIVPLATWDKLGKLEKYMQTTKGDEE